MRGKRLALALPLFAEGLAYGFADNLRQAADQPIDLVTHATETAFNLTKTIFDTAQPVLDLANHAVPFLR